MPYTTYGLLKATRSHTVSNPTAVESLETGRPNACNQCHLDRPLAWTAERLRQWYGTPVPRLTEAERTTAASLQWMLEGDAAQRALMAWTMGWGPAQQASGSAWLAPHLAPLLDDPYEAVRIIASRSLRRIPGFAGFEYDLGWDGPKRGEAVAAAIQRWQRLRDPGWTPDSPAVLIDAAGELNRDAIAGMRARRNDRPVWLTE